MAATNLGVGAPPRAAGGVGSVFRRRRRGRRPKEPYNKREALAGYLFILPWLIGFGLFTVISMTYSFGLSFTDYDLSTDVITPVGTENYRLLVDDPKVLTSLGNTFVYAVLAVPLELALALVLALLLQGARRGAGFFRVVYYLPKMTPAVATASV